MRCAVQRTCAAFVFLSFVGISLPSQNLTKNESPVADRVWLAIEEQSRGRLLIEPIATVEDSVLTSVQTSCLSEAQTSEDFSAKYLQSGKKYTLLFGGASIGEGQVGEMNRSNATAGLTYSGSLKIRGQMRALATNAEQSDFRVAAR
jgi:hypothetical protein